MNARAECTVVVCSCDRYADLLRPFCELWSRFWPDCPFDLALVTESDPGEGLCFDRTIACGKGGNWCSRLVTALSKIETPYVLLLCDDYYLEKPVDTALVLRRLEDIRRLDALNLRMIPNPTPKPSNSAPLGDGSDLLRYRHSTAYCIATQAGIWNKDSLSRLAAGKSSIWEFERYGSFDPVAGEKPILVTPTKEFPFVDAVHKGCWEKFGLDVCVRNGVDLGGIKRTLPPLSTRIVEGLKAVAFMVLPTDLLVRVQNRFSLGAKEPRPCEGESSGKNERLFSLDLLRGIDMFYLACGSFLIPPLLKWLGAPDSYLVFLCRHPWYGFTLYDIIMPLFIFMCGAAVPFALGRRLVEGRPGPGYWRHVMGRVALLWVLGMLAQGDLATLDIHQIGFYNNTLQTIAVGYLAAALLLPVKSLRLRIAVPVALLVAYGLIVHFGGDYTKDGNISQKIDLAFWGAIMPADNKAVLTIRNGGYSWILPSMMFPVITLAGCFSTQILRSGRFTEWRKAAYLAVFGAASLAAGWALYFAGVEMVKHIFTVSFTLQAIGWSILALDALYVATDIWRFRRGMGLLILFGQFALTAYLCESVFSGAVFAVSDRLFSGVERFFSADFAPVVKGIGFAVVVVLVLLARRRMARAKAGH